MNKQQELFGDRDKGFESLSEILPRYTEILLDRIDCPPIPKDEAGQVKWVMENL